MTKKGSDPVSSPLSQHRVSILAAGNNHISSVVLKRREGKVGDGSRVAGGDERSRFWVSSHMERVCSLTETVYREL